MSPVIVGIGVFALMLIFLIIGVPVPTTMGFSGALGLIYLLTLDPALVKLAMSPVGTMNSYTFTVIPMFMLMANIIASTGVGKQLYDLFYKIVGRFRGGLAMATILACGVFAAISSSSLATSLTIGLIALPEMRRLKYSDELATTSIAAGGTLGCFIPPSGNLMVYGIMASQSISKLLIAGIVPGVILIFLYLIVISFHCHKNPAAGPAAEKFSWKEIGKAFLKCGEIIALIIIVIGGMFGGIFTPTEAGAVGVFGAILITLIRRKLTWRSFFEALNGALRNCGMIYAITIGADILNVLLSLSTLPSVITSALLSANLNRYVVIFIIFALLMFLGCFIDSLAMMILTLPVLLPIVTALNFDLVWFGVFMTACVQMANITPPVGMNLFVVKGLDDKIPIGTIYRGIWPYIIALFALVAVMVFFPNIVTFLPNLSA
ncbi:MAG: TRAP transporter large permease [Oscillospiraceae bacterium]|nr:TRAP transporter large permease [Oscillospiraceae bacterium]